MPRRRRRTGFALAATAVCGAVASAPSAVATTSGRGVAVAVELHRSALVSGARLSIPVLIRLAPGASPPVRVSLHDPCLAGAATTTLSPHEVPVDRATDTVAQIATETVTFDAAIDCTAAVSASVVLDDGATVQSAPVGVVAGGTVHVALSTTRVRRTFLTANLSISSDTAGRFDVESSPTRGGPWTPFNSTTAGPKARAPVFDADPGTTYFRVRLDLGGGSNGPVSNVVALTAGHAALPDWLAQLNDFRTADGLPPVAEDPALDAADALHVRYEAATGSFGHVERASSPLATTAGEVAGASSVLSAGIGEDAAVDDWMGAPFHALCLLNPYLETVGFAYEAGEAALFCSPRPQTPATAVRAIGDDPAYHLGAWPREWPASASTVDRTSLNIEEPDPTASCPSSWRAQLRGRAGTAVIVSFGPGAAPPSVGAASLSSAGTDVPVCVVTETNYTDPTVDPALGYDTTTVGREVLGEYHSVVLIPAAPLAPGAEYSASISSNDGTVTWSFGVAAAAT